MVSMGGLDGLSDLLTTSDLSTTGKDPVILWLEPFLPKDKD